MHPDLIRLGFMASVRIALRRDPGQHPLGATSYQLGKYLGVPIAYGPRSEASTKQDYPNFIP